jgi:hypothetical protein
MGLAVMLGMGSMARGQAVSGATPEYNPGPTLPMIDGNFQYSLFASEVAQTGYTAGVTSTTNFGGTLEYISRSVPHPSTVLYSGGYLFTTQPGIGNSTFQNLSVSQGLVRGGWVLGISDSVSYLPNAPSSGLVGVPGVGGIGLQPITSGNIPSQTVLTNYAQRVSNTVSGNIERSLTRRTSISGVGSYGILRFLDNGGEDSSQIYASAAVNRLLDARDTLSANVAYQNFEFSGGIYAPQPTIETRGINIVYERLWSRALSSTVSVGPQWISGYTLTPLQLQPYPPGTNPVVPSRLNVAINASLSYTRRFTVGTLSYTRGVNGGSGVQAGATADTVVGGISTSFGPNWTAAMSAGGARTLGLNGGSPTQTFNAGAQLSRRITRHLSAYVSDTVQYQSLGSYVGINAFNGTSNAAAIGISYTPRSSRMGQF